MNRRSVCLLTTVALLGAIGAFARASADRPAAAAPPPTAENERYEAATSICGARPVSAVQTTNVNLISGDGRAFEGSSRQCATPQNEPTLAVNPTDPRNLIAAANDFRTCCDSAGHVNSTGWAYFSLDGGATWTNVAVSGLTRQSGGQGLFARFDIAEDPALAFAPDGTAYYTCIVFATDSPASGIAVSSSTDGGATWSAPQLVQYTSERALFNDKAWIAVGDAGQIAVTWSLFRADSFAGSSTVQGALSSDGGATWNKPVVLSGASPRNWGAIPLWRRDGSLVTVFDTARASTDSRDAIGLSIYRSGEPLVELDLGRVYDGSKCFALNAFMRQTLSGEAFRVSALPTAALDPSSQTIAVAWVDGERGCKSSLFAGATNAQVKLVLVNGTNATKPRIVTRGADKALPAVAYRDGRVLIGFHTRTFAPADCVHNRKRVCLDYAYSTSANDFATEHRLSDGSSNPYEQFDGAFIGDYSALAVGADGVAHAVWTDSRAGDQNLFGAAFRP